jgi:chloramphenicol-sensitive protein RarD
MSHPQADTKLGLTYAITGYSMWGLTPIFWHALTGVGALEITAQRMFWVVVFMGITSALQGRLGNALSLLKNPKSVAWLTLTSILVTINWGVMVWCVVSGQILQASLGYYLTTLITIGLGVVLLGETLSPLRILAFLFGVSAFGVQVFGLAEIPWAAPILALSFGFYGYFRKRVNINPVDGLFVEALLILPLSFGYMAYLFATSTGAFLSGNATTDLLLVLSGPISAVPLALFAASLPRARLTTLGFLQYIGPSIQLLLAIFIYDEAFTHIQALTFACVWTALALLTVDGIWAQMRAQRASRAALKKGAHAKSVSPLPEMPPP